MHPRLVQHHVGKLRQAVFRVLHAAVRTIVPGLLLVRLPEGHLVDPAGLLQHPLAETEGLEHLHGAAGDAVGLPELQRAVLLLDDAGADVGKRRQLRRQGQAGRTAADDQHVDLAGSLSVRVSTVPAASAIGDRRPEAVEVELHWLQPFLSVA